MNIGDDESSRGSGDIGCVGVGAEDIGVVEVEVLDGLCHGRHTIVERLRGDIVECKMLSIVIVGGLHRNNWGNRNWRWRLVGNSGGCGSGRG